MNNNLINELIELIHDCKNDLGSRVYGYCEMWIKTYYPNIRKDYYFSYIDQAFRKYNNYEEVK